MQPVTVTEANKLQEVAKEEVTDAKDEVTVAEDKVTVAENKVTVAKQAFFKAEDDNQLNQAHSTELGQYKISIAKNELKSAQ